eukprot:4287329-Heterocapsa_arctica.AAC.1
MDVVGRYPHVEPMIAVDVSPSHPPSQVLLPLVLDRRAPLDLELPLQRLLHLSKVPGGDHE